MGFVSWDDLFDSSFTDGSYHKDEYIAFQFRDEKDQQVLDLIRGFRSEFWQLPEAELLLSIEALSQRAVRIVTSVAAVYHPDVAVPQYQASLTELLHMVRRVTARLNRLGTVVPFKYLGNRKLSDYQRYYQLYRKINEHPVL